MLVQWGTAFLPAMIIWDRKTLQADMTKGELPGTIYGLSSKGWTDQEHFKVWFEFCFLRYALPICPILIYLQSVAKSKQPSKSFMRFY